ncbi:TetR/AcrR family transcriptional regulator [Rheinheimera sp.]|uniref:TetR/AcrR family transcriptional regulator n=1 Tax=Rheinheimera sp. TaxID=1869214 RepID=UPI003AF59430
MSDKPKRHLDPQLAEARRAQVINAASDSFRRKGYHGAGMAEISKTAGMSAGHIYNYFDSKEAIIEAIIERDKEEMFSVFNGFLEQPGDLLQIMVDGADDGVEKHLDLERSALELEMLSEAARNEKVAALLAQSDTQARALMKQLMQSERSQIRHLPEHELDARIAVMFSMITGLTMRRVLHPELDKDTVLLALNPVLKTLLTP